MSRRLLVWSVLALVALTPAMAETVSGKIYRSKTLVAGADDDGRALLFTPKPVQPGSSHSHFDTSASPNLLMEPSINSDLSVFNVDLTRRALQDMGWRLGGMPVVIAYSDGAGEGFNDPTRGDARKAALEAAAGAWGRILGSSVDVNIEARFAEQTCGDDGATLASAGPRFVFRDFPGGEPGVWYAGPLAESLADDNLSTQDTADPASADLRITFNSQVDEECLAPGTGYYYGLDNDVPAGGISFVNVAMHELGHGLGFIGLVDERTGEMFRDFPDIFSALTYDTVKQKHWSDMTNAQRKKSAKRERQVSFDGRKTTSMAKRYLQGRAVLEIDAPDSLAGNYDIGEASFGPAVKKKGVAGDLVIVDDGSAAPTLGCERLVNRQAVKGKIAVIDRGECLFAEKVKNAQKAGAIGVVIVNNIAGSPPGLGGSDDSIRIPAVSVTKKNGKKIKRALNR